MPIFEFLVMFLTAFVSDLYPIEFGAFGKCAYLGLLNVYAFVKLYGLLLQVLLRLGNTESRR